MRQRPYLEASARPSCSWLPPALHPLVAPGSRLGLLACVLQHPLAIHGLVLAEASQAPSQPAYAAEGIHHQQGQRPQVARVERPAGPSSRKRRKIYGKRIVSYAVTKNFLA